MLDRSTIESLARLFPKDASYLDPAGIGVVKPNRVLALVNAPDFGWQFAKACFETGRPLPPAVLNPYIQRVYDYLTDDDPFEDFALQQVIGIYETTSLYPAILKAYLLCPAYTLKEIANKLSVPEDYIEAFHTLFFNVRPRLSEPLFLQEMLYPNGRQPEFSEGYMKNVSWEIVLLRCVYHRDFKAFFYLAGINKVPEMKDTREALATVEGLIMGNAVISAEHLGGMQQRSNVGFTNAKSLISSAKIGGGGNDGADDAGDTDPYLADKSVGQALMDELLELQKNRTSQPQVLDTED